MSVAIPGCTGLFSILQEVFRHKDKSKNRIRLSPTLHGFLEDFWWLAMDLVFQPTHIAKLILDREPATNGACDVLVASMGGVHFVNTETSGIPILWRQRFPDWICHNLPSFANPKGSITNSDLELADFIVQNNILAQAANVCEQTAHNSYDNIAPIFWQRKGATRTL